MSTSRYDESSILELLSRFGGNNVEMHLNRNDYFGLLTNTHKHNAKVRKVYHYLLFNRMDGRVFTDMELQFLLGDRWETIKAGFPPQSAAGNEALCLERNGGSIDLLSVPQSRRMSPEFDILGRGKGVSVYDERNQKDAEMPPMIALALSLTCAACRSSRGMFVWQPKETPSHLVADAWSRVPDIMYLDYIWLPKERARFLKAGYRDQRDFLCASLRLQKSDMVLPFVVDYKGNPSAHAEDARVTAAIDGNGAPKAAISIPGAAYMGWFAQMTPDESASNETKRAVYSADSKRAAPQWILSETQKSATRCPSLVKMYEKATRMYAEDSTAEGPQKGGKVLYYEVLQLYGLARQLPRAPIRD